MSLFSRPNTNGRAYGTMCRPYVCLFGFVFAQRPASIIQFHVQERNLATAFSVAGPVVWNSIPAAVRDADTVSSFKRKLKTHFFSMCFDDV